VLRGAPVRVGEERDADANVDEIPEGYLARPKIQITPHHNELTYDWADPPARWNLNYVYLHVKTSEVRDRWPNGGVLQDGGPTRDAAVPPPAESRTRKVNADKERKIVNKLKQAVLAIKRRYPTKRNDLTSDTMAAVVVGSREGSLPDNGYSFEVIKKMIDGTYEPANRRGFSDPWRPPPS
jgi:hypothetical protein